MKLRELDEDKARLALAEAQRQVQTAEQDLVAARARARDDERHRGPAAEWQLAEAAHFEALRKASQAERAVRAATEKLTLTRRSYTTAYTRAEGIRRVAETRRAELIAEASDRQAKQLDELGLLLHFRQ